MSTRRVAAIVTTGALTLAACSGGGTSSTGSDGPEEDFESVPASAGFEPTATGPAPKPDGAKTGGTVIIKTESVPDNMDPSTQYYNDAQAILRLTTRTLTQFKMKGKKSVLVPDMATDLGKRSKDGLSWSFTLKDDVKFEDGSTVKASDVAYSVKRSFATEEMPGGPTFQIEYFNDGDTYKGPWKSGEKFAGITHDDSSRTVTFHLRKKMESFPYFASLTLFGGVPKAKDTKLTYKNRWVATGPYKIDSYAKGSRLVLAKNDQWDPASDPSRNQFPDRIEINFQQQETATAKAIMANNGPDQRTLSWAGVDASIVNDAIGPKKNQVATGADPCTSWGGATIDTTKVPLAVRRAIVMAWPTEGIRLAGGSTRFSSAPGGSISVPQMPGFTRYALPKGQDGQGAGNPEKAREMLKKAGKIGFVLSYYYGNDTDESRKVQGVKQEALERAGFTVKAIGVNSSAYRGKISAPKAPTNMGNGVSAGWCYDWPSGDSVYPPLFKSTLPKNSGVGNVQSRELDQEMERVSRMPLGKQGPEWSKIDKKIVSEIVPVVPMSYSRASVIFGTKVGGVIVDPNQGMPHLTDLYVK
ncbi:ABC transporter substrate-binding protein [Demetria terragena]|uniref:ABC transporter substrate-binding protein n=1 Tax=Demetria terragena TaxID=63959 RepID=UPI0012E9CFA9|nr:ABC transporter substrate-binding protein [Demetria terragena]